MGNDLPRKDARPRLSVGCGVAPGDPIGLAGFHRIAQTLGQHFIHCVIPGNAVSPDRTGQLRIAHRVHIREIAVALLG